jgi:hypothetical protein
MADTKCYSWMQVILIKCSKFLFHNDKFFDYAGGVLSTHVKWISLTRGGLWNITSWLQTQRFRVRFPAMLDFVSSSGSGMGSTQRLRSKKLRLTTVGDPPRWQRDTPLSAKVGTKFRQQVAVAQSVQFVCGLKATEFVLFVCRYFTVSLVRDRVIVWKQYLLYFKCGI